MFGDSFPCGDHVTFSSFLREVSSDGENTNNDVSELVRCDASTPSAESPGGLAAASSLTRVVPQEAQDQALQALPGEPRAQAGGGREDGHDHEGRQHQPDHHTGAQRHREWPPSRPASKQPVSALLCVTWFSFSLQFALKKPNAVLYKK